MTDGTFADKHRYALDEERIDEVCDRWAAILGQLTFHGFGKKGVYEKLDNTYGADGWLPAHYARGKIISRYQSYFIYEDAYYHFFKQNPDVREWIVNTASEVYDIEPSNVDSGLDYTIQESDATHLQDISIRRVLTRLTLEEQGHTPDPENLPRIPLFKGDHLVQIRGKDSEGYRLNPGQVPFHDPTLILDRDLTSWWQPGSVEDWYQKNKVLLVDPDRLPVSVAGVASGAVFLAPSTKNFLEFRSENGNILWFRGSREVRRGAQRLGYDGFCEVLKSPIRPFSELRDLCTRFIDKTPTVRGKKMHFPEFESRAGD